jgi:hypothetical protein
MTNAWSGPDPAMNAIGIDEEQSTRFVVHADITVTAIRVYSTISTTFASRNAHFWDVNGNLLDTIDIPDTLGTSGWQTFALPSSKHYVAGDRFDVSIPITAQFAILSVAASGFPRDSTDGAVTSAIGFYTTNVNTNPNNVSGNYLGIDIVYTNNTPASNQAPGITGMLVSANDLHVASSVNLTDETPSSVTVKFEWGDGTSSTPAAGITSATHTYASSGTYAVLATAIDSGGLQDSESKPITVSASLTTTSNEEWLDDIFDAVVSDAQRSGYFDKVNQHEPKRAPNSGLTAAVWVQSFEPIALNSGLASTSARIIFTLRIYTNMLREPQDAIDPMVMRAVSNLMRRYHDDFDFGGAIRNIDLLGAFGVALAGQAGYLEIDGKLFRIFDMTIPCLVDDVWPQVN